MISSVMWSSLIDYPENICTILFISGCNFDCEFCYNKQFFNNNALDFEKNIFPNLIERKNFINHIIISGGECTISPDFCEIVDKLYENEFKIGIHTNGSRPDLILRVMKKLDYVGMDIKNDFDNYSKISRSKCEYRKNKKINQHYYKKWDKL